MYNYQQLSDYKYYDVKFNKLKAGDILLFRHSRIMTISQKIIMFAQALLHIKHGHYDTTHAGICTGFNKLQQPMIAHISVVPNIQSAYLHEPLHELIQRDGGDRSFIYYRSTNSLLAHEISTISSDEKSHIDSQYSISAAASCIVPNACRNTAITPISKSTFCSQFVIEILKQASSKISNNVFTNLAARSTPKKLESFLDQRPEFYRLNYASRDMYQTLQNEIHFQLGRLSKQQGELAQKKYLNAKKAFVDGLRIIKDSEFNSEWEKARLLTKMMLPIFQQNTGYGFIKPTSYTALASLARKMSIFSKDVSIHNPITDQPSCRPKC